MAANAISLGGTELTDDGRTFDENADLRMIQNELANGSLRRYVKANKRKFSLSWTWMPNTSTVTSDKKGGRDAVRALAYAGTSLTLLVRNIASASSTYETYTVFVESYSEKMIRRDTAGQIYFYDVTLSLVEV